MIKLTVRYAMILSVLLATLSLSPATTRAESPRAPLGPGIELTSFNDWPDSLSKSYSLFGGGVFDGLNLWMVPAETNQVVKLNTVTGETTGYSDWPSGFVKRNGAFNSGVFDGSNIWMVPSLADRVIKVDPATGNMTGYNDWPSGFVKGTSAFNGGVFDGKYVWLIPSSANKLVRIDPVTEEMTGYDDWPNGFTKSNYAFSGGVFDGTYIWLIPSTASHVIRLNPETGEMKGYSDWPSDFAKVGYSFNGGIYDGHDVWMIPYSSNQFVKLNTATGEMTGYDDWPDGFDKSQNLFNGGVFDGRSIWTKPSKDERILRIDTATGSITGYNNWPTGVSGSNQSYNGGIYDGANVWLVPSNTMNIIRISSIPELSSAVAGDGQAALSWEPVHSASGYAIYERQDTGTGASLAASVSSSVYQHTVTGLSNGETYYYTVKAVYSNRTSAASNELSVTPVSDNANLSGLTLSNGALSPDFAAGTTSYTANVEYEVSDVKVTPTTANMASTLTVNGTPVASGSSSETIPLTVGSNTITIVVTAASGTTKTYEVTVTRKEPASSSGGGSGGGSSGSWTTVNSGPMIDLNGRLIDPSTIDVTKPSALLVAEPKDGVVYAQIPGKWITDTAKKNEAFYLEIKAPFGSYRIPVRIASIVPGLQELLDAKSLTVQDVGFRLLLTDETKRTDLSKKLKTDLPQSTLLSSIVSLKLEVVSLKTGLPVQSVNRLQGEGGATNHLTIPINRSNAPTEWGAYRYDEETSRFEFVPARLIKSEGGGAAGVVSVKSGIYVVVENPVSFLDTTGHWGEGVIRQAAAKGLVIGIGEGRFAPNRTITRSEFATMLMCAVGSEAPTKDISFKEELTREQLAGMLADAIGGSAAANNGSGITKAFRDIGAVDPAYAKQVEQIIALRIMEGTGSGLFEPQGKVTRAQAAAVLIRTLVVLGYIDKE
ncbi:S-layer homology domain-containing protein [Paenibacillus sp. NPDC058071]|uniref:S-layer homology domain-containing protein n=1 Tax=Paenibacillus sp. NPDC058071 TaxID=3346326 RepID=UPI0036DBF192